jgi:chromosome segregation ATPase
MTAAELSESARRQALQLRLERTQYKIAQIQKEITDLEGSKRVSKPGLRSLRDRLDQLKGIERGLQRDLRVLS